jgi:DNA-directed RNA polymerase subunit RPC12/RpoP
MPSKPGPPMSLANMRQNGVRMVTASCANCGRSADVNVDALLETMTVPEAGQRLRCSQCGAKTISTRPAWHTGSHRPGTPDFIGGERPPLS